MKGNGIARVMAHDLFLCMAQRKKTSVTQFIEHKMIIQ